MLQVSDSYSSIPRASWVWFSIRFLLLFSFASFLGGVIFVAEAMSGQFHLENYLWPGCIFVFSLLESLGTIRRINTAKFRFESEGFFYTEENYFVKRQRRIWYWQITAVEIEKMFFPFGEALYRVIIHDQMPYEYTDGSSRHSWPGRGELGIERGVTRLPGFTRDEAESFKSTLEDLHERTPRPQRML